MEFLMLSWDISSFLRNLTHSLEGWGALVFTLLGTACLIMGGIGIFRNLTASQQNPVPWWKVVALLIAGGGFLFGGFALFKSIAQGGNKTINDLGHGGGTTILIRYALLRLGIY